MPLIVTFSASTAKFASVLAGAYTTLIVQLFITAPPAKVVPQVPGSVLDRLKSGLPAKAMVRPVRVGLFAGLVTVSGMLSVPPSVTCPKAVVVGVIVIAATPVPVTETV